MEDWEHTKRIQENDWSQMTNADVVLESLKGFYVEMMNAVKKYKTEKSEDLL